MAVPEACDTDSNLRPSEHLKNELFEALRNGARLKFFVDTVSAPSLRQWTSEVRDEDGRSLLHLAVTERRREALDALLKAGLDAGVADEGGWTALHSAAALGDEESCRLLLHSNSDMETRRQWLRRRTDSGSTPLMYAASKGHLSVVELLLSEGADANERGLGGATALSRAVATCKEEVVDFLLSQPGIDLTALKYIANKLRAPSLKKILKIAGAVTELGARKLVLDYRQTCAGTRGSEKRGRWVAECMDAQDGYTPVGKASASFMKKLEGVIKADRRKGDADEE